VPIVFQSTVSRCINCVSTWDNDQHSLTIEPNSNKTAYFYLDVPVTISRLEKLAESDFDRALQISDELKATMFHSPLSRGHVREIHDTINSMQANLTAEHYEFVLQKLDRVEELRTLALQEEDSYIRAEAFVNSVRQDILSSQGYLSKWQLVRLSRACESLDQGNYTSALEWAKQANDLPREPAREEADPLCALSSGQPPWPFSVSSPCLFYFVQSDDLGALPCPKDSERPIANYSSPQGKSQSKKS
jgi:hypothetical protein